MKKKFFFVFVLLVLWVFLFPIYRDRTPAFGCFDDCSQYMVGFFINSGKHLYSEIFHNHQPLTDYMSALVQRVGKPESLYQLVFQHRMATLVWALAWDVFLTLRFGCVGLGFSFLYETTKGYLFGERFLAEAFIVYPIVYLLALVRTNVSRRELIATAFATWFVIFSREPYVPLALLLFGMILWKKRKNAILSLGIFLILSVLTIVVHNPSDYFFNVVTVNTILAHGNIFQSVAYPVLVFFGGTWNFFRTIEVVLFVLFWLELRKNTVFLFLVLLALANIRPVAPGTIYYQGFQHMVGYGVLIFLVLLNMRSFLWLSFIGLVVFAIGYPKSYLYDRVDRNAEFTQNYGQYYVPGEVVRSLSNPTDTLFLDGYDDLIYWQAKRLSPYPYSWYTSVMHEFPRYTEARTNMFLTTPPDFYYGRCDREAIISVLPDDVMSDYARFFWQDRPTCLFIRKQKLVAVPKDRLEQVNRQFEYSVR